MKNILLLNGAKVSDIQAASSMILCTKWQKKAF